MFVLFGNKAKMRPVKGGRRERRKCPECEATAEFVEHDRESKYHVFFQEILSDEDRVFVCSACGEAMDLEDTEEPALAPEVKAVLVAKEQKAREVAAKERERVKRNDAQAVDRELEELKKRLAKK